MLSTEYIDHIVVESTNLCIHAITFYLFLFVSYRGVVFVLVVLVMTRLSSPKTVFICVFIAFSVLEILPVHPCGRFLSSIYLQNLHCLLATFPRVSFVVLFPIKLVSRHSDFICKRYSISGLQMRGFTFPHLFL